MVEVVLTCGTVPHGDPQRVAAPARHFYITHCMVDLPSLFVGVYTNPELCYTNATTPSVSYKSVDE